MKGSIISEETGRKTVKTETRKENVLELSGKGLQNMSSLPKHYSTCDLILDNNNITKIEKLDVFPELSLLSIVGNHLVRMNGINFAKNLKSVNLSNNGIVSMEGLCWLVHLEYLDLSKNNIKRIQNVSYCTKLKHMDLSENSITEISNLKSLVQLEVLLLHGNTITTLERADDKLPDQIETLSISGNGIPDLNEIHHLSCLLNLKHFSITDNPCVMTTLSLPFQSVFNFRPFTLSCLPSLLMLDGSAVTDSERQEAERLRRDENLGLFTFGNHLQLVLYLGKICSAPDTNKISKDQSDFLEDFLRKRRMEIFGAQKDAFPLNNDVYNSEGGNVKANDSLQSSSYSVLDFSENTRNASGNFLLDEESETDTLRSESRFLPVFSPLKKSLGINHRQFQTSVSWEVLPPSEAGDLLTMSDDLTNKTEDMPIMSEEEAKKLINLAATILQSHIRGFLVRRKFDYRNFKRMHTAASKIQALWRGYYFRHHSDQGLNFRNELRVRRLQKYISTLCLIMQKSEKQYKSERQQMLEIITLLYEKFTQLSEKVKELESSTNESSTNESTKMKSSVIGLEESLHPVFFSHPRLPRNVEEREDIGNSDDTSSNVRESPVSEDVGFDLKVDKDSKSVVCLSKDVEVDHVILGPRRQDIMEKRVTLMDQEDHFECYKKVQKVEVSRVEEDKNHKILYQEDDPHWDKESGKSEHSTGNSDEDGTSEDSYTHKTPEVSEDELSTDIPEGVAKNGAMSSEMSEAFTTANVCELLKTIESDKKQGVDETYGGIERLHGDSETREVFKRLDVISNNPSVSASGTLNDQDNLVNDDDLGEHFEYGKPSCSTFESGQEIKRDKATGESDKFVLTNYEDNVMVEKACVNSTKDIVGEGDPVKNVQNMVLQQSPLEDVTPNNEGGILKDCSQVIDQKPSSHHLSTKDSAELVPNSSEDVPRHVEEVPERDVSFEGRTIESENDPRNENSGNEDRFSEVNVKGNNEDKSMKGDNGEPFERDLTLGEGFISKVDEMIEATGHSEFCVVEDTKLGEETELSYKEVIEKPTMIPHAHTDKGPDDCILKDSLDQTESCSHDDDTVVAITGDPEEVSKNNNVNLSADVVGNSLVANVENNLPNMESNNEARDELQHNEINVPGSNTIENVIKGSIESDEESALGNLEQEIVIETTSATEVTEISPKLGERASSLLSALKDEITGVSSKDMQSEQCSTYLPAAECASGGDIDETKDTESDSRRDFSTSENQEITNVDK